MKWLIGVGLGLGVLLVGGVASAMTRRRRGGQITVRNRIIEGPGGFRYELTDDDLLWLARAVWGEAGDRNERGGAAVAWAMVQYHALVIGRNGQRPAFSTLTALLRSYCQPINPRWASMDASGCRERPGDCSVGALDRRRQITNASWSSIPSVPRGVVEQLAAGSLANPVPGMVDWAARDWSRESQTPLINIGGNKFGVGRNRRLYREA
jgi:hypothetical protein